MTIDITSAGTPGVHSFRKVNINADENYIYFQNEDIPPTLLNGASYLYTSSTGSIDGIAENGLVYAKIETPQVVSFENENRNPVDFTGFSSGTFSLNDPVVFNNTFNIGMPTSSNQAVVYYTDGEPINNLVVGETYFLRNVQAGFIGTQALYEINGNTHTFTTCGQTGAIGPTAQQILSGYSTTWHGQYLSIGDHQGYQDWTVPVSGIYQFDVRGAAGYKDTGSGAAGRGARIRGRVQLNKGEVVTIVVGQRGAAPSPLGTGLYGGSGGASWVVRKASLEPLFVAGGGTANAAALSGQDGQTTVRGGTALNGRTGGVNGFGGPANDGRSAGGGGFLGAGQNSSNGNTGGGAFQFGLQANPQSATSGGRGGFGGGGSADSQVGHAPGAGGYSGGAGSRSTFTSRQRGGGGGSFITRSATDVATSDGRYEDLQTFNGQPITNLNSYNANAEGSVVMTLVQAFTSGNTIHPTAQDAEDGTNAIPVVANGNSYHAFVPITYDIKNNKIHFLTPHGFASNDAISFSLSGANLDIPNDQIYYVVRDNDFTIGLSPIVNFQKPGFKSTTDIIRKIVVNTSLDTINIPSHGFAVDQPVQYSSGGGQPILPLQNGATYYIGQVVDPNNVKLKIALDSPNFIDLTSAGTGTNHSLIFLTVNFTENTLYIPGHNLSSGQSLKYSTNGGTPVGGLVQDETYYVIKVDNSTIRLATDPSLQNIVQFTDVGTGTHSLFIATIDFSNDVITIPQHGFLQGELVEYDSRGQTPISGLDSNQTYYVIFIDGDNIQLATNPENAQKRIAIDLLESPAGIGRHTLTSLSQTPDGIYSIETLPDGKSFTLRARGAVPELFKPFNPRSSVDLEFNALFFAAHGFITGTKVVYNVDESGVAIGGLSDQTEYYVVSINQDYFRLATSLENALSGITIDLTNFGSGTSHSFTSSQLNGSIVGSGNVSISAGSVLVNGVGTSFAKILKVGDPITIYPSNITKTLTFGASNVNTGNDRIEIAHDFEPGDYVKFNAGTGVPPTPLVSNYYYYVGVVTSSAIQLFTTKQAALDLSGAIDFGSSGTGTGFTLTKTEPVGPIVRRITAVGSDTQVTVDRPYASEFSQVAYSYPTFLYVRPSGYALHRPFDGGVEMSTGSGNWYSQIIRQTRKYFRYQSGKGIQTSFAITFKPSIDIESMERFSSTQIEVKTRRPHNLISGLVIEVAEAEDSSGNLSTIYNGQFPVTVVDLTTFRIGANQPVPQGLESKAYGFPQFHVISWENGAVRSGMFDFQNGMFFEFDGKDLYCVRRSSTQQTAGTVSALRGSEQIFGTNTKFLAQFDVGDSVVLRGQTYRVVDIKDDTTMSVRPEYRGSTGLEIQFNPQTQLDLETNTFTVIRHGLSQSLPVVYNSIDGQAIGGLINGKTYYADVVDADNFRVLVSPDSSSPINISSLGTTEVHSFVPAKSGIIATKTVDTRVPQKEWNIDKCDGTGPSGYDLDLSKIQMCYMDYSWYGAGKIRFGFKTNDGLVRYVHEFKHNNVLFESYFRSGNLPARYEVVTFANPTYVPSLFHWGTSVIMDGTFDDDRGYLFTAGSQTLNIPGTTTKSFAGNGIDLDTDLVTSLTHGFKTGDIVQFQSIAADGFPGLNSQNPETDVVGSNEFAFLNNTSKYGILVNSPDRIHLTPPNATFVFGGTVSRSGTTVTVVTSSNHNLQTGMYVGVYGITNANLVDANGTFTITRVNDTTFTYTKSGTAQTAVAQPDLAVAEVINFISRGNIQYTYFLHPDGSLNNTTGPNYQPLLSLRLSPSADSGLTGKLGDRDVINRMQVRMQEIGVSTNELVEVKLILNGRLNNLGFTPVDPPSLVELVEHTPQDTISGGIQIYNFQAEANSTTNLNLDTLFELSNSILGGDNIFPDGPDIMTIAVSRLTGNDTRTSAKVSWLEAQA